MNLADKALKCVAVPSHSDLSQASNTSHILKLCHGFACRSLGTIPTFPLDGDNAVINVVLNNLGIAGLPVVVAIGNSGGSTASGIGL